MIAGGNRYVAGDAGDDLQALVGGREFLFAARRDLDRPGVVIVRAAGLEWMFDGQGVFSDFQVER